jgi:GDSL-like Lipase/Acylhydrolase family
MYVGDDLTYQSCDPTYMGATELFQDSTPNAVCYGVQGETSAQTQERLPGLLGQNPAVVVILTGLNDVRDGSADTSAIADMVQLAQAHGVTVILGTLPPSTGYALQIQQWNAAVKSIAASCGTQLADYYQGIVDPSSVPGVAKYWTQLESAPLMDAAGIYPNPNGFNVMWQVVCVPIVADNAESEGDTD